jgi:hypothetical protein
MRLSLPQLSLAPMIQKIRDILALISVLKRATSSQWKFCLSLKGYISLNFFLSITFVLRMLKYIKICTEFQIRKLRTSNLSGWLVLGSNKFALNGSKCRAISIFLNSHFCQSHWYAHMTRNPRPQAVKLLAYLYNYILINTFVDILEEKFLLNDFSDLMRRRSIEKY